jgi:hypothetical protein
MYSIFILISGSYWALHTTTSDHKIAASYGKNPNAMVIAELPPEASAFPYLIKR